MLGLKEIPAVIIRSETTTIEDNKGEKQRIALLENLHRKDLSDIEKAEGILSVYTSAGYQPDDVIRMIKSLDNRGYQSGTTTDRNLILSSLDKRYLNETDTNNSKNEPAISEKFLDIVDSIGCGPNTQYKYLQIVVKLEPSILKKAEDKGLSLNKKNMLINKVLNKHPRIQKQIIDEIAYKPEKEAIVQDEANNYVYNYGKREKVTEKMVDDTKAALRFLEISRKIKELMYLLTGHRLTQGDVVKYEPIHVDNTQDYRSKIVRGLTVNEVTIMEDDLEVLGDAMSSMLDILDQEGARPEE